MESPLKYEKLKTDDMNGWVVYEAGRGYDEWIYAEKNQKKYKKLFSTPWRNFFKEVFLPRGFPESVHDDYVSYQLWDTVQAFASTILGTLTTHSIMRGVGVGDSTATPLAAAITWILKDGTGMIGRILFAWWNGPELDAQCKKWRLFADVLNDMAMGIELCLPYLTNHATAILCVSSGMKSLVGVAGGATRAAITQHQALSNNLADVSAKDGSQETCVNLIASIIGILILSYLNVSSFVEIYYVILVVIHIYANYSAVRSLRFETFNENRLAIVVKNYLTSSIILSTEETNQRESLSFFQRPSKDLCGFDIIIGGPLDKFVETAKVNGDKAAIAKHLVDHRSQQSEYAVEEDSKNFSQKSSALIIPDINNLTIYVALDENSTDRNILNAYFEAFLHGIFLSMNLNIRSDIIRQANSTPGPLLSLYKQTIVYRPEIKNIDFSKIKRFIRDERFKWSKLLDNSEWKQESNLLSIGPYRSYWNSVSNEN